MKIWMNPQEGFLSGTISDTGIDLMHIEDFEGKIWEVHYEGAFIPPVVLLEQGEKVKIIGKLLDKKTFQAEEIRPWGGPENRVRRQGRQGN